MSCEPARPHHVCVIGTDSVVRAMLAGWLRAQCYSVAECEQPPGGAYESCGADASDVVVLDADGDLAWAVAEVDRLRAAGVVAPVVVICPARATGDDVRTVARRELAYPLERPVSLYRFVQEFERALKPARDINTIVRIGREVESTVSGRRNGARAH